jgi:ribosomal peptide maturation radical SAM protein 1
VNRIALVCMPFASALRPSIGLSLLKAALAAHGFSCDMHYLNLRFAARIGSSDLEDVAIFNPGALAGEWVFAAQLFGDQIPSAQQYVDDVLARIPEATAGVSGSVRRTAPVLGARQQAGAFLDDCMAAVPWHDYAIVGFTTTFQQTTASLALARRLKERYPHLAIIFGGANQDGALGVALHRLFPFVDYVCSGEGDLTFPLLVERILDGQPVGEIPGVIRRVAGKTVVPGILTSQVADLDALQLVTYDDFIEQRAAFGLDDGSGLLLPVETARGCWWGEKSPCTFCGLNDSTIAYRTKSPGRVLAEFEYLVHRYHPAGLAAVDNILNMRAFRDVLPRLAELNLGVGLFFEAKANLRRDQVRLLHEAGVSRIQPGIESLNSSVLRLMRKGVDALQNIQLLRWCAEHMVQPDWNLLAGFPGEDPADYARQAALMPLLVHLPPPLAAGLVALDRFSALFACAGANGITNLRPATAYRYVYPFPAEDLTALARFFAFDYADGRDPQRYLEQWRRNVEAWTGDRNRYDLFSLTLGDVLLIRDTRPVAVEGTYRLSGPRRAVYEYCDQARTRRQIAEHLGSASPQSTNGVDVDRILEEFTGENLMLHEDGRYLSLAVSADYQLRLLAQRMASGSPLPFNAHPTLLSLASQITAPRRS